MRIFSSCHGTNDDRVTRTRRGKRFQSAETSVDVRCDGVNGEITRGRQREEAYPLLPFPSPFVGKKVSKGRLH